MSDSKDLRRRLTRLGRTRPKKPAQATRVRVHDSFLPGEELRREHGHILRVEKIFQLQHQHGNLALSAFLEGMSGLHDVLDAPREGGADLRWLFLDTETTGLAGGAGSFAFLVGVGVFDGAVFRLRQYFMRTPAEEPAMLDALKEDFRSESGFVTYNGRTFDIPLLEMRYMIGLRERLPLGRWPQLDLLHLSRRLWKRQLPDCRLGTVERHILHVERSEEDVPGANIPAMYQHYLKTGETKDMRRVLYHNEIDILSLVVLAAEIQARHRSSDTGALSGSEALGVARWHVQGERYGEAEQSFRRATASEDNSVRRVALRQYAAYLKRAGRRVEAVPLWEGGYELDPGDPAPCIELAKFYEWEERDVIQAHTWATHALEAVQSWQADWRKERMEGEIRHRLRRLDGKLEGDC